MTRPEVHPEVADEEDVPGRETRNERKEGEGCGEKSPDARTQACCDSVRYHCGGAKPGKIPCDETRERGRDASPFPCRSYWSAVPSEMAASEALPWRIWPL